MIYHALLLMVLSATSMPSDKVCMSLDQFARTWKVVKACARWRSVCDQEKKQVEAEVRNALLPEVAIYKHRYEGCQKERSSQKSLPCESNKLWMGLALGLGGVVVVGIVAGIIWVAWYTK